MINNINKERRHSMNAARTKNNMNHEEKIGPSLVVTYLIKTLKIIYSETVKAKNIYILYEATI
jgi:hypothetical protein